MKRRKDRNQTFYYFRLNAFKFPGPNDVYFSCAIDISPNETFTVIFFNLNANCTHYKEKTLEFKI